MALAVDFNIQQSDNAREFTFTETTGAYNASTNVGGYGSPNDTTASVTVANLKVTPPGGTEVTLDLLTLSSSFPTTDSSLTYTFKTQALDSGSVDAQFADGAWLFEWDIDSPAEASTVTSTQTILVSGKARCCVMGMLADISLADCDGSDRRRALEAWTYYRSAIACAAVGDSTKFADLLVIINKYCDDEC